MSEAARLLYGPAGWSYEDWHGAVYPKPQPPGFSALEFLARDFDFVEVNTTFYHTPSEKLAYGWVKKTRHLPHFGFWIKLNQAFTHQGNLDHEEIRQFRYSLQPLADEEKLLGFLAQFPYSFKYDAGLDHLGRVCDYFGDYPLAVEFRHNSWDRPEMLEWLRGRGHIFTNIDQPAVSASLPLTAHLTHPGGIAYFRLHGRNARAWFSGEGRDARYDYDYSAAELGEIAAVIRRLKEEARKIYVSGNNHFKGSAVRNLLQLKQILSAD